MENNNNFELPNIEKKNYLSHIDFKKIENDLNKVKYIKYQESKDDSHNTLSINFDELLIINNYTNNLPKHKIINTEVGLEDNSDLMLSIIKLPIVVALSLSEYIKRFKGFLWFNKKKTNITKANIDNGIDEVQHIGRYKLDSIKGLKVNDAIGKINEFSRNIDTEYIIQNQDKLPDLIKIVDGISRYTIENSKTIINLNKDKYIDYINRYNDMRGKINKIAYNKELTISNKNIINSVMEGSFKDSYNLIYKVNKNKYE